MNILVLLWKYSNQNYITWINKRASSAKNYLILDFTIKGW